eukprot:gene18264-biopygen18851
MMGPEPMCSKNNKVNIGGVFYRTRDGDKGKGTTQCFVRASFSKDDADADNAWEDRYGIINAILRVTIGGVLYTLLKCDWLRPVPTEAQIASFKLKNSILGVHKVSKAYYTFNPWDTSKYTMDNREPYLLTNQVQAQVVIVKHPCMDSALGGKAHAAVTTAAYCQPVADCTPEVLHTLARCQVFQSAAGNGPAAFSAACDQYGAPAVLNDGASAGGVDISAYGFATGDSEDSEDEGMDVEAELKQLRREHGFAAAVHGGGSSAAAREPVVCYGQACIFSGIDTLSPVVRAQVLAAFQATALSGSADIASGGAPGGAPGGPVIASGTSSAG